MTTCYHVGERLFFVHIPKCAGTSIGGNYHAPTRNWDGCWLDANLPGWTRDKLPNGHQPVRAIERITGHPIDWWRTILVTIRNPFEQQLSQWKFWRDRGRRISRQGLGFHPDDRFAIANTLEQFVADPRSNGPNAYCGDRWRQAGGVYRWWCSDADYQIPPNVRIVRVEDGQPAIEQALGVSGWSPLPITNTTEHDYWEGYYSARAAAAVQIKFAWSLCTHYPDLTPTIDLLLSQTDEAAQPATV